jgi:hypothetical protein
MNRLLVFLTVMALLLASCGKNEAASAFSQAVPGEQVILTETRGFDVLPYSVVPYGREPALALSDLELTQEGGTIDGKVSFARQGQGDFTLVLYLSMPDELLIGYLDTEEDLTLHLPEGTVLFGMGGYELSGEKTGTLEFSLTAKVYNGYSVIGQSGTAYVFAVPGSVNPQSMLPGDQTDPKAYQANSNVIKAGFDF